MRKSSEVRESPLRRPSLTIMLLSISDNIFLNTFQRRELSTFRSLRSKSDMNIFQLKDKLSTILKPHSKPKSKPLPTLAVLNIPLVNTLLVKQFTPQAQVLSIPPLAQPTQLDQLYIHQELQSPTQLVPQLPTLQEDIPLAVLLVATQLEVIQLELLPTQLVLQ